VSARPGLGSALLATLLLAGCAGPDEPAAEGPPASQPAGSGEGASGDGPDYVTRGPSPLDPAECGIGAPVPTFATVDLGGEEGDLASALEGKRGLVVVLSTLGCPVCKAYHPSLQSLAERCEEAGFGFLVVAPSIADSADELAAKAARMGWRFPIVQDHDYAISDALGARRTTDTFVIDADGVLRYRGALDDQYGINYRLPEPRRTYLLDAIAAVAAGESVAEPAATAAPGCKLSRVSLPD
jgi:peroxiredoxin